MPFADHTSLNPHHHAICHQNQQRRRCHQPSACIRQSQRSAHRSHLIGYQSSVYFTLLGGDAKYGFIPDEPTSYITPRMPLALDDAVIFHDVVNISFSGLLGGIRF